jgi:hypothetical protein
MYTK